MSQLLKNFKAIQESESIQSILELNQSMAWARDMYDQTKDPAFLRILESCEDQLNGEES